MEAQKSPTAEIERLLERQNKLLEAVILNQKSQIRRKNWSDLVGFVKQAAWFFGILWTLWQAKLFFTNLAEKMTPDFSNLKLSGENMTESGSEKLKNAIKGFENWLQ